MPDAHIHQGTSASPQSFLSLQLGSRQSTPFHRAVKSRLAVAPPASRRYALGIVRELRRAAAHFIAVLVLDYVDTRVDGLHSMAPLLRTVGF
jgi:hypothetical protein